MDKSFVPSLWTMILLVVPAVSATSYLKSMSLQPSAFLQMQSTQTVSDQSEDILFYISDNDMKDQVAVDFSDAVNYAFIHGIDADETVSRASPPQFMTGDLYDNDLTDVSKLSVYSVSGRHSIEISDFDEETKEEKPPEIDKDESEQKLVILKRTGEAWPVFERKKGLDLDELEAAEVDRVVIVQEKDTIPIPAQKAPSREFVYDLDEEAVFVAGIRRVLDDLDDIPMFFSTDQEPAMVGDLFNNKRTDQMLLRVLKLSPRPPEPVPIVQKPEEIRIEVIDTDDTIQKEKDAGDLDEIDVVFQPEDFKIITDHTPRLSAYDRVDFMVGDLFDNDRTDSTKLTQVIVVPETISQLTWFEAPAEKPRARPVSDVETIDVDEIKNVFVTPETVDIDVDEVIVTIKEVVIDRDELSYSSPRGYMSGDEFNNQRTDSSLLIVNELQGPAVSWVDVDIDDQKTVFDLNSTLKTVTDIDDLLLRDSTYTVLYNSRSEDGDEIDFGTEKAAALDRFNENLSIQEDLLQARLSGERFEFYDKDDVPTFFSFDAEDYIAGDMYDNKRSDSSKLSIGLESGTRIDLWEDQDESRKGENPAFLQ